MLLLRSTNPETIFAAADCKVLLVKGPLPLHFGPILRMACSFWTHLESHREAENVNFMTRLIIPYPLGNQTWQLEPSLFSKYIYIYIFKGFRFHKFSKTHTPQLRWAAANPTLSVNPHHNWFRHPPSLFPHRCLTSRCHWHYGHLDLQMSRPLGRNMSGAVIRSDALWLVYS